LRDPKTAFAREPESETQDAKPRRQVATRRVVAIVESSVAILETIWIIMVTSSRARAGRQLVLR
jgi:hypothetical protein